MFKMVAIILDAPPYLFDHGKCNITEHCGVSNASCSIKNSLKQFIFVSTLRPYIVFFM